MTGPPRRRGGRHRPSRLVAVVLLTQVVLLGAATSSAAAVKPDVSGVIAQFGAPSETRPAVGFFIVNIDWRELQPDAPATPKGGGAPVGGRMMNRTLPADIAAGNRIDAAIATVKSSGGRWAGIKVRVNAGAGSPQWVLDDFGSVTLTRFTAQTGTYRAPKFWNWTAPDGPSGYPYRGAYLRLQNALARYYDTVAPSDGQYVREMTIAGCMTEFPEPMARNDADAATLWNAGYRTAKDADCQLGQIEVAASAFQNTTLSLAVNPYSDIQGPSPAQVVTDVGLAENFAGYCRDVLHARCLLQNNELCRDDPTYPPDQGSKLLSLYSWMAGLNDPAAPAGRRGPIAFQTNNPMGGQAPWSPSYSPPSRESFLRCAADAGRLYQPTSLEIRSDTPPENEAVTSNADVLSIESTIHARSYP